MSIVTPARPTEPTQEPPPPRALPTRMAIARFGSFAAAQRAAERLAVTAVPGSAITVTASELQPDPDATTASSFWESAVRGAIAGGLFGLVFGSVWAIAGLNTGRATLLVPALAGLVVGVVFGAVVGIITHWGEKDPERKDALFQAKEFALLVDEEHEHEARRALRQARDGRSGRFRGR